MKMWTTGTMRTYTKTSEDVDNRDDDDPPKTSEDVDIGDDEDSHKDQ